MKRGMQNIFEPFTASTSISPNIWPNIYSPFEEFSFFYRTFDCPDIKDHHEPIISAEIWDKAKEIREDRYRISNTVVDGTRMKSTRKFAFNSMCQCGFCGKYFSRRSHNQDTRNKKPVWKCRIDKSLSVLESKRKKLTDMLLDDKITKDAMMRNIMILLVRLIKKKRNETFMLLMLMYRVM
jgi:hypothetical protein